MPSGYLPIPFTDASVPGLLTVDLPLGIEKGQSFRIVVRQVTDDQRVVVRPHTDKRTREARRVAGAFQLTIPVSTKAAMLPGQQRLLSTLRWIEWAIPLGDRWELVFGRHVAQVAARVDDLGGNSSVVAPSSSGQWQAASAARTKVSTTNPGATRSLRINNLQRSGRLTHRLSTEL